MEESIIRGAYDLDLGSTGPIAHPARHPWKARPPARQEPPGALEGACFFFFFFVGQGCRMEGPRLHVADRRLFPPPVTARARSVRLPPGPPDVAVNPDMLDSILSPSGQGRARPVLIVRLSERCRQSDRRGGAPVSLHGLLEQRTTSWTASHRPPSNASFKRAAPPPLRTCPSFPRSTHSVRTRM